MKSFHSSSFSDWENTPVCDTASVMTDFIATKEQRESIYFPSFLLPVYSPCNMHYIANCHEHLSSPGSWLWKQGKASLTPFHI